MNFTDYITKNWNFKKDVKQNVLTFNTEAQQRKKNLRKMIILGLVIVGVALFFHNPILGMAFIIGSVTYGTASQWSSGDVRVTLCCVIDSTHFAVAGIDEGLGSTVRVRIASVSSSTISWGTEYNTSLTGTPMGLDCLDSTHLVMGRYDSGDNVVATILVFSGTTISSKGSDSSGLYVGTWYRSEGFITALSSSTFVVSFSDEGSSQTGYGTCIIGSVSGTTISWGNWYSFTDGVNGTTGRALVQQTVKVDSTHFVVIFVRYVSSTYKISVVHASVSETTISFGTIADVATSNVVITQWFKVAGIALLDSTHLAISYVTTNNGLEIDSVIASISGTSLSVGTAVQLYSSSGSYPVYCTSVTIFDSTHFAVSYYHTDYGVTPYAIDCSVSGTTITAGSEVNFDSNGNHLRYTDNVGQLSMCKLDSTHIAISYLGGTTGYPAYAIVGVGSFVVGPANVKTVNGLAITSVKTVNGLAIGSVKSINGLT